MSETRKRKDKRIEDTAYFATWNLEGRATNPADIDILSRDMRSRKIAVGALQETMNPGTYDINSSNGDKFIFLGREENSTRGGLGFYVAASWVDRLLSYQRVSSRIGVIRFCAEAGDSDTPQPDLIIINVYGFTQPHITKLGAMGAPLRESFYALLEKTYHKERAGTDLIFVMGDFNSKIGTRGEDDEGIMGDHGKGKRNQNGEALRNFLLSSNLFVANTHFRHRPMQTATWHGGKPATHSRLGPVRQKQPGLHNQIDYVLTPPRLLPLFSDARAYIPDLFEHRSDHSMVIASIMIGRKYKMSSKKTTKPPGRDYTKLAAKGEEQAQYAEAIKQKLDADTTFEGTAQERYKDILEIMKHAAEETLPLAPRRIDGVVRYFHDKVLERLSKQQQRLSGRIYHVAAARNDEKRAKLRRQRNIIFKRIKERKLELARKHLDKLAEGLQKATNMRAAFEFVRVMQKNSSQRLVLHLPDGSVAARATEKIAETTRFYKSFFTREGENELSPWIGLARPLRNPICGGQVSSAARKLRNNRAAGIDGVVGEMVKYGGEALHEEIASLFNQIFTNHESVQEMKQGILIPLNKPGKQSIASETRPIILLIILRKLLALIILDKIFPAVRKFLSAGQHAYQAKRSATEVAWSLQWILATVERYEERARLLGIDLSKAFDCLNRATLLSILTQYNLTNEDQQRMIQYLLSETELCVRVEGKLGSWFATLIGTPQGDSLSPILFLIYLEHITRTFPPSASSLQHIVYADDDNILIRETRNDIAARTALGPHEPSATCQCAECRLSHLEALLPPHFALYSMKMNVGKKFKGEIAPGIHNAGKLVGSYLRNTEEVALRIKKAENAFGALQRIWLRGLKLSVARKMKIYNAAIKPILLYNSAAATYTQRELDRIDATHRTHLRRILQVYFPAHISNVLTYERTASRPISIDVTRARWAFFGHVLRLAAERRHQELAIQPAYTTMEDYFRRRPAQRSKSRRAATLTTLPRLLETDLRTLAHHGGCPLTEDLPGATDGINIRTLTTLGARAQDRDAWKEAVQTITDLTLAAWKERNAEISAKRAAIARRARPPRRAPPPHRPRQGQPSRKRRCRRPTPPPPQQRTLTHWFQRANP